MILANEQVARRLESARVAGPVSRARAARSRRDRASRGAAREPRGADSARAEGRCRPPTRRGSSGEISTRVMEYQRATGRGGRVLTSLVLRALKQAYYSTRNIGHAGLASQSYCHFTSPIRRYPDLVVHRALLATIGRWGGAAGGRPGGGCRLVQRDGAGGGRARARGRRRVLRLPARARPARARLGAGVRRRGDRRDRGGRVRVVRPRCGRGGLRGTAAGAPYAGRLVRPRTRSAPRSSGAGPAARCGWRPGHGHGAVRRAAPRADRPRARPAGRDR